MSPGVSGYNLVSMRCGNQELFANRSKTKSSRGMKCANGENLLIGQSRRHNPFASDYALRVLSEVVIVASRLPPLFDAIRHVVGVRSKKDVGGIAAGRVVAAVATNETRRDVSVNERPCDAVSVALFFTRNIKHPISSSLSGRTPQPAFVLPSLFDPLPEAVLVFLRQLWHQFRSHISNLPRCMVRAPWLQQQSWRSPILSP